MSWPPIATKSVEASFTGQDFSSDEGALLLREVDQQIGLTVSLAEMTTRSAERAYQRTGRPAKRYHSFSYNADSWENFQRVIVKVEVSRRGTHIRYTVTDMRAYWASHLYEIGYCKRGAAELRIKDHKRYLRSDRTSWGRFEANQLRLFLHSAAYVLIHSLQKTTPWQAPSLPRPPLRPFS